MYIPSDDAASWYSDIYKSAFGVRPRGSFEFETEADWDRECDFVIAANDRAIAEQKADWESAIEGFEALISELMEQHDINRETAIRWDMDAYGSDDKEEHCYNRGLPFSYAGEF